MNSNLLKLEFNKIIENLSKYCTTYIGKEICSKLLPSNNSKEVKHNLLETTQAYSLLVKYQNAPIESFEDLTAYIKSLESMSSLSAKSLLQFSKILNISSNLKSYFNTAIEDIKTQDSENSTLHPYSTLLNYFEELYTNQTIYYNITNSILDENTISDDASKALKSLRRNRRNLESNVKEKLNSFIHSSSYSKYIMEPIITIRNDRYVIPVKIEYKENIKGLIHDISASGSSVYIEPTQIFELNNKINNIKLEENIEIEKILENLSAQLYPIVNNLKSTISIIGKLDFIFAKACYSREIEGIEPCINIEKFIDLKKARHPLIDPNIVVPIDIHLGKNFNSLIITGPNTGGKTVTLKTVGILCLMACCGLHIPADENSSIYVFDKIFADIGDEQSIQESLSTFSSHIVNIVNIIENCTENSLVLIDELGSGTDPLQGANLAISILEYFYKKGALTLTTTHYSEIKNYALITDGFENASSEFDIENLCPTYKILIGVPGRSNAFAISKKLGLPSSILQRAESLLSEDSISIEELIKNIYDDKLLIEKEKDKILKNSNQVEMLRKQLENDVSDVEQNKKDIINKAKNEARNILLTAKDEANTIIKELNNLYDDVYDKNIFEKDTMKNANMLREKLNNSLKNSLSNNNYENKNSDEVKNSNENIDNVLAKISVGLEVLVKPFNMIGIILTLPNKNNEVIVQFGNTKTNVKIENIELIDNKKTSNAGFNNGCNSNFKAKSISSEINVIGQNVEDAIFVIDKYLDDCYLANLPSTRIVHGKGTGKLREGIHTFLRKHPHVKSFRLGTFGEGEMGVTIVEFK